jgi:hypothetical protein
MWIKSKEGLFNSTAYRSIVAEHFRAEGPGDKPMSVVVGHFLGQKKRDTGANTESDPFDVIATYEGEACSFRADHAIKQISTHLGWHSKQCDIG